MMVSKSRTLPCCRIFGHIPSEMAVLTEAHQQMTELRLLRCFKLRLLRCFKASSCHKGKVEMILEAFRTPLQQLCLHESAVMVQTQTSEMLQTSSCRESKVEMILEACEAPSQQLCVHESAVMVQTQTSEMLQNKFMPQEHS